MGNFEGFPLIIVWELTLACNLRCSHCASSAELPRTNELTLEESLAICDQFPALLVQEVDFTGGEPLLRHGWAEIAVYLRKLDIRTQIITNGLTLGQDTVYEIKDAGIGYVGISLDGLEATHDYIRGHTGLFRQVLTGIERVLNAGLTPTVITTVCSLNLDELTSILKLLRSIGVSRWQVQPVFALGRSLEATDLQLTEDAYVQLASFIQRWKPKVKEAGLGLEAADSFGYFTDLDTRETPWRGCPAGLASCAITSDGKIQGCLSLPDEFVEGDLRQDDLWDIWFRDGAFSYTRGFQPDQLGHNCVGCEKGAECKGGCTAMSYGYTGSVHNDPYCLLGMQTRSRPIC